MMIILKIVTHPLSDRSMSRPPTTNTHHQYTRRHLSGSAFTPLGVLPLARPIPARQGGTRRRQFPKPLTAESRIMASQQVAKVFQDR